jgi:hypothetical protein
MDEVWPARLANMGFGDMASHLLRASEVVMGLPDADSRRRYAAEYLGRSRT